MTERVEPWQRFEMKVDPARDLADAERARRAKISYRAFMRRIARKSVKTRAAKKGRKEAALQRRLAKAPGDWEMARFEREQHEAIATKILWAASQRGEKGIAGLRRRQLEVRADCLLCRRPFSQEDRLVGLQLQRPKSLTEPGLVSAT